MENTSKTNYYGNMSRNWLWIAYCVKPENLAMTALIDAANGQILVHVWIELRHIAWLHDNCAHRGSHIYGSVQTHVCLTDLKLALQKTILTCKMLIDLAGAGHELHVIQIKLAQMRTIIANDYDQDGRQHEQLNYKEWETKTTQAYLVKSGSSTQFQTMWQQWELGASESQEHNLQL